MQTIRHGECQLCSNWSMNGGIGASNGDAYVTAGKCFCVCGKWKGITVEPTRNGQICGRRCIGGFYADLAERWRVLATATYLRYALGDRSDDVRWSVGQRYTLGTELGTSPDCPPSGSRQRRVVHRAGVFLDTCTGRSNTTMEGANIGSTSGLGESLIQFSASERMRPCLRLDHEPTDLRLLR